MTNVDQPNLDYDTIEKEWKEAHPLRQLEGWEANYCGELDLSDLEEYPLEDQCVGATYTKSLNSSTKVVLMSCCHGTCDAIYLEVDGVRYNVAEYDQILDKENLDIAVAAERVYKLDD